MPFTSADAAIWGRKGGKARSPLKAAHARVNGRLGTSHGIKGGRPIKLPPAPEGFHPIPPPDPHSDVHGNWRPIAHLRRFPEYVAELCVRKRIAAEPVFTEEEIRQTLRRMGRYDLIYRRKQFIEGLSKKARMRRPRLIPRKFRTP